jgi:hypothetical protein
MKRIAAAHLLKTQGTPIHGRAGANKWRFAHPSRVRRQEAVARRR